jgi:hypothetical protein
MAKIVGRFCERKLGSKKAFAKGSFRWKKSGRSWVLIGCPRGKWKRDRCSVGTRAYVVLAKTLKSRCCPKRRQGERCVVKG